VRNESYLLLARQVEQLRALETRPVGRPDVLDPPSLPHRPAGPPRALLALGGFVLGRSSGRPSRSPGEIAGALQGANGECEC
jgi:uncharacterized protein involved in exopolysaccharide biosynthesis